MAYFGEGRVAFFVAETTPGVDPEANLADMVAIPIEELTPTSEAQFRERARISAVGPGSKDPLLRVDRGLSGRVSLYPVEVVDVDSYSVENLILRACGMGAAAYDAGPPKTLTSERVPRAGSLTLTAYIYHGDSEGNAIRTKLHGLQGTCSISWGPSDELNCQFTMQASSGSRDAQTLPTATYDNSNDKVRAAYSGLTAKIETLQELGGDVLYEGCCTSGSIDLGMDTAKLNGIPVGAGGKCPTRSNPAKMPWSLSVEKVALGSFDPEQYMESSIPLKIVPQFIAPDDALDEKEFVFYGQITSVSEGVEDGFTVWELAGHGLWLPVTPSAVPGLTEGSTLRMIQRRLAGA